MAGVCGIYEIVNLVNGHAYYGSSKHVNRRLAEHRRYLTQNKHHSIALQRAWNKHGSENFKFNLLAILEEKDQFTTEQRLLDQRYDDAGNCNMGRSVKAALKGRCHSQETLAKMRDGRRAGVNSVSYGAKRSAETRKLQSELKLGKPAHNKGTKHRPESIQKMSAALKGKPNGRKGVLQERCKHGHEFVEGNIYIHPKRGTQICKTCANKRAHEYRERRRTF